MKITEGGGRGWPGCYFEEDAKKANFLTMHHLEAVSSGLHIDKLKVGSF